MSQLETRGKDFLGVMFCWTSSLPLASVPQEVFAQCRLLRMGLLAPGLCCSLLWTACSGRADFVSVVCHRVDSPLAVTLCVCLPE